MSNGHQPQARSSLYFHFSAGLGSGILSAVLLQPADLLKTRVQQSGSASLRASFVEILNGPNAIKSFWRGTLPSALRTGCGSALYFTSLNALRRRVAKYGLLGTPGSTGTTATRSAYSSTLPKLSNLGNLVTGAVARGSAGFLLMPMTIIKVRYESNLYAYKSILGAGKDILRKEGIRGFFSGFGATAARDAPYAGLYVLFYEQSKTRLSSLGHKVSAAGIASVEMKGSTSAGINFVSGVMAAGLATAITNPFDAIKTRIQLRPTEYKNTIQAAKKLFVEDGPKAFFDGLGIRMARKALSSALAWTLYEELVRRAELAWEASNADAIFDKRQV